MQAVSIYILIRLEEGETDHNNLDFLLHTTVIVISRQFVRYGIACESGTTLQDSHPEISWKTWIFDESRRRLAILFRILNMLVYFEPATMCSLHPSLILAPLPAKKQLWDASDSSTFKAELDKDSAAQNSYGLAADGDIIHIGDGVKDLYHTELRYGYGGVGTASEVKKRNGWEEWCSGMDTFGGLVMLAASLIV
jgi:hypothetical protein